MTKRVVLLVQLEVADDQDFSNVPMDIGGGAVVEWNYYNLADASRNEPIRINITDYGFEEI